MDEIEIQVFDEITNYKEKFGFFTIRQWIFVILMAVCGVPTWIFLSKSIGQDLTGYVIIAEAAIFGFFGFVNIRDFPAEKIIPYWFRQYYNFSKPVKYMTTQEYQDLKEQKKNKKHKKEEKEVNDSSNAIEELFKNEEVIEKEVSNTKLTNQGKSVNKKITKKEKELIKAKKKYGYLFPETNKNDVQEINNEMKDIEVLDKMEQKRDIDSKENKEINDVFNSLSNEEKKVLLKLIGK